MIKSKQIQRPQLVLVVDDQEINRDVLGMILEDDYDIIYACDGREALQKIEEYKDSLSVVLMDLIMPVMDGFEVLSEIRGSEELKQIPVIVLKVSRRNPQYLKNPRIRRFIVTAKIRFFLRPLESMSR